MQTCYQINYQTTLGGGEIYTRAVCKALAALGRPQVLFVHRDARFWDGLGLGAVERISISSVSEIEARLPETDGLVLTHNLPDLETAQRWSERHQLAGFLHMPLWDRDPAGAKAYRTLLPVSAHVRDSALARGLRNVHPEPLLAVADLALRGESAAELQLGPRYDLDSRKLRDYLAAHLDRARAALLPTRRFVRRAGLTLGIVSRLTPIKQFPLLFSKLAPILAAHGDVWLEVFGSGSYGSVRDLRRVLMPLGGRVRFWGRQHDVAAVFPQLDYVLSGLPEKEALGLNLIEAQAAGTPVIAVRAPPFTETVVEGETGFLYPDPREDQGAGFGALIARLRAGAVRPDPRRARAHLDQFSEAAFRQRLDRALRSIES